MRVSIWNITKFWGWCHPHPWVSSHGWPEIVSCSNNLTWEKIGILYCPMKIPANQHRNPMEIPNEKLPRELHVICKHAGFSPGPYLCSLLNGGFSRDLCDLSPSLSISQQFQGGRSTPFGCRSSSRWKIHILSHWRLQRCSHMWLIYIVKIRLLRSWREFPSLVTITSQQSNESKMDAKQMLTSWPRRSRSQFAPWAGDTWLSSSRWSVARICWAWRERKELGARGYLYEYITMVYSPLWGLKNNPLGYLGGLPKGTSGDMWFIWITTSWDMGKKKLWWNRSTERTGTALPSRCVQKSLLFSISSNVARGNPWKSSVNAGF